MSNFFEMKHNDLIQRNLKVKNILLVKIRIKVIYLILQIMNLALCKLQVKSSEAIHLLKVIVIIIII